MVGWHHRLNGHKFGQTPGDSEGQGSVLQSMQSQRVRHGLATEQQLLESEGEKETGPALKKPTKQGWGGKLVHTEI